MKVRIFGYLDFYAPTGRLGLKMAGIDPNLYTGFAWGLGIDRVALGGPAGAGRVRLPLR